MSDWLITFQSNTLNTAIKVGADQKKIIWDAVFMGNLITSTSEDEGVPDLIIDPSQFGVVSFEKIKDES